MAIFIPSGRFAEEMTKTQSCVAAKRAAAEAVKAKAIGFTPQGFTGETARSYVVTEDEDGRVFVGNTDFAFHMTEFGSANNPPYAPLRRGAREVGLEVDEASRGPQSKTQHRQLPGPTASSGRAVSRM